MSDIQLFDHSTVDHLNIGARRRHMQTVFSSLGVPLTDGMRRDATEDLCWRLSQSPLRNVSRAYFEYDVDVSLWNSVLRHYNKLKVPGTWPWTGKPSAVDLREGHSVTYREWRVSQGLAIEEVDHNWCSLHRASGDQLPISMPPRLKAAEYTFAAEKARIEAFKSGLSMAGVTTNGDSGGQTGELEVTPLLSPNFTLLVRGEFRAQTELPPPCPAVSSLRERKLIWRGLGLDTAEASFQGYFELTIPSWMDFNDLFYGHDGGLFLDIKRENLIDKDLVIGWNVLNNQVSLIVGPNPTVEHDPKDHRLWFRVRTLWWRVTQWLREVHDGRPLRLRDYLLIMDRLEHEQGPGVSLSDPSQLNVGRELVPSESAVAASRAKAKRNAFDLWMPEIYAILTEPRHLLMGLFDEWVDRLGVEFAPQRLDAVRDSWGLYQPVVAWKWCLEKRQRLGIPSDATI
ncbi:hypothetical protein FHETE_5338 [Fusarium heterosporum]|uniref:Uncharacterized protein n=1 Tax=Fusarium heterosporum TaxID=42747 RepID=A0A8H5WM77_FUSHE|nr:hypothetical protein FHETE_5338 [Fusarium heterosporum]